MGLNVGSADVGDGVHRELARLPRPRWKVSLARVKVALFARGGPVPRDQPVRVVGQGAALDNLLGDQRADLAGRPCKVVAVAAGS